MRRALRVLLVAAGWLAAPGCGDPLTDREFEGQALFASRQLRIRETSRFDADAAVAVRYALFWHPEGLSGEPDDLREQARTSRPLPGEAGPWNVFEPPADDFLAQTPQGGRYGLARLRAYDDLDGDLERGPDEPFLGDSLEGLLYLPESLDAERSPFGRPLPRGFHRVEFPLLCGPSPRGNEDCEVAFGEQCREDDSCGAGGACLMVEERDWGHGMCGLRYAPQAPCVPREAALYLSRDGERAYFLKACEQKSDCRDTGEHCDPGIGACLSGSAFTLVLGGSGPERVCQPAELPVMR